MRILHLATSTEGGAGIAAVRSHAALYAHGVESSLLMIKGSPNGDIAGINLINRSKSAELLSSASTLIQSRLIQKSDDLLTPWSLSQPFAKTTKYKEASVIHVHAFYNLLNVRDFEKLLNSKKKIFITLHDQRLFTGGCHYSRDCKRYVHECHSCPQSTHLGAALIESAHRNMFKTLASRKDVTYVAPSLWIKNMALESSILSDSKIEVVRNPIPEEFFSQVKTSNEKKFRIGFVAQNLENPYKGLDILINSFDKISTFLSSRIELMLIGKSRIQYKNKNVDIKQREIHSQHEMAMTLSGMDLVVIPSNQDNFPSVIGESLACGTRVIGTQVGGIPEALDIFGLPSFNPDDSKELARLIESEVSVPQNKVDRDIALREFSEENYAKRMLNLYKKSGEFE
jgi:glycosyltransferase involved in cell wall biosynthesis